MNYLSEFKKFLLRGNVVDLAVAFVIGAAFGAVKDGLCKMLVDLYREVPGPGNDYLVALGVCPLQSQSAARRRLDEDARPRGRAWINGREVGGASARFDHLARSHD